MAKENSIGSRIKAIRDANNLVLDEFGARLGFTSGLLSRVERGEREPSDKLLKAIVREFQVDEGWLRTGKRPEVSGRDRLIGQRIRSLRRFKGLDWEEFAAAIRVESGYLLEMEEGKAPVPEGVIADICRTYGVDREALTLTAEEQRRRGHGVPLLDQVEELAYTIHERAREMAATLNEEGLDLARRWQQLEPAERELVRGLVERLGRKGKEG